MSSSRRGSSGLLGQFKVLQALLFGIAGYVSGKALHGSGVMPAIAQASSNNGGRWASFVYGGWQANGGSSNPTNPFGYGGEGFLIKTLAFLLGGYTVQDAARHGVKAKHLSVLGPLAIGMALDDVGPRAMGPASSMGAGGARW